jgi:TonB family protein
MDFNAEQKETVFDVKILLPLEPARVPVQKKRTPPEKKVKKRLPRIAEKPRKRPPEKKIYAVVKKRPDPPDQDLLPDTISGDGLGEIQKGLEDSHGTESTDKLKNSTKKTREKYLPADKGGSVPSGSKDSSLPRAFLFDSKTIEKYARRGSPKASDKGRGITFYAPEFKNRAYMRMLKDRIESIWKYPKEAVRRGISGDLRIKFSIRKNGKLDKVEILRTSGYRALDEAVIQALKNADPYWPLPDNYEKDVLEITGHFIYVYGINDAM